MKMRRFAVKGMIGLLLMVVLCLFFAGTIRTMVTPKVQFVTIKTGTLAHRYEVSGSLSYTEPEEQQIKVSQSMRVRKVNVRPGDYVTQGTELFSLQFYDEANQEKRLLETYEQALLAQQAFDQENANRKLTESQREHVALYQQLQRAMLDEAEAWLAVKRTFSTGAEITVPETGYPEMADGNMQQAIDQWRVALENKQVLQNELAAKWKNKAPNASILFLVESGQSHQREVENAEKELNAFYAERDRLRSIVAPHDGYIVEVNTQLGGVYEGDSPLYTMTKGKGVPVIQASVNELDKAIPTGTAAMLITRWGRFETEVLSNGVTLAGEPYINLTIPAGLTEKGVSLNRLRSETVKAEITMETEESHALVPVSAIHGTGHNRYVYVVDEEQNVLGRKEKQVHQLAVTVVDEADGMAAVKESLTRFRLAYREDRVLRDGSSVMEAVP